MMQFTVTAQELLSAAGNVRSTNTEIQGQIQQMQTYVQDLMTHYSGTAAIQLMGLSAQWKADSDQLNYVLSTIADGLTSNAHNYVQHETVNTVNLGNIASGLPPARF